VERSHAAAAADPPGVAAPAQHAPPSLWLSNRPRFAENPGDPHRLHNLRATRPTPPDSPLRSMRQENADTVARAAGEHRRILLFVLGMSAVVLLWGVWWGWPTSFDQHDPTRRAMNMLWQHTLDPGVRYWGAFGYQEVLLLCVLPITALKNVLAIDPVTAQGLMYLLTRVLWAIKGVGIVAMAYALSKALFANTRAALISMCMVPLAPGFVAWSHIPQVDLVHAFWYTAAATCTALAWRGEKPYLLWLAAVAAGLAAGVKYVGGIIAVAPMAASFLLFPVRQAWPRALALGGLAIFTFFLTTPLVTGDPLSWLPAYTADTLANNSRDLYLPLALWTLPAVVRDMIGPGTALLGILGLAMLAASRVPRGEPAAWLLLALSIVPYYGIFVGQHVATIRYMVPITGTLAVAIGFLRDKPLSGPAAPALRHGRGDGAGGHNSGGTGPRSRDRLCHRHPRRPCEVAR